MSQTLAARLQNLKIKEESGSAFVTKLSTPSVYSLWKEDNREEALALAQAKQDPRAKAMRRYINTAINKAAVKNVLERCNHEELELIAEPAPIKHNKEYKKRVPANVLHKRLLEFMTNEENLDSYFNKYFEHNLESMKTFMSVFEIDHEENASAKDLVEQFVISAMLQGAHVYLSSMPLPVIQKVAMNEELTKTAVASKERLVDGILKGQLPAKRPAPEVDEVTVKEIGKKRSIKNSDYWGMWQYYNLTKLVDYCKENNIKTSGTKHEVITRILEWREADKENRKKFETKDSTRAAAETRSQNKKEDTKKSSKPKSEPKKDSQKDGKRKREVAVDSDDEEEEQTKKVVIVKPTLTEKVKKEEDPSPPKKLKQDPVVEDKPSVKKTKTAAEKVVSEPVRSDVVKKPVLEDIEDLDDDAAVKVIEKPELYTVATLKRLCEAQDIDVPKKCKTHGEYVTLINNTVLDLDNLTKYSLEALKKYAKREQLEVTGSKLEDYVEAILESQKQESEEGGEEEEEKSEADDGKMEM